MISVGIDVSKGKSTVCFFKPGGEVLITPYEVTHTKDELDNSQTESILTERRYVSFLKTRDITIGLW